MSGTIWGLSIAAGIALVFGFWFVARRRLVRGRTPVEIRELHSTVADKVDLDTFATVFQAIGDAYSIDPRLVRPSDPLKNFLDMDSWVQDAGTEKLNGWLKGNGVNPTASSPVTVFDLVMLVHSSRR